ncbi:RNA polymerase sigma factor [Anatilimnocola sp. NA78]|uniref:RNA polymerase sigma factor n=1 Tax=Anatilimnocola sp. NA78 TaxID=3415683 RepID=UPI003CE5186D
MNDDDLLRRCQQGDDRALTQLVQAYQARIFQLAMRVLNDQARAEDATTDALASIWSRCSSWRGEGARTWIQRVAWRVVLDHHRARRRWWRFWELDDDANLTSNASDDPAEKFATLDRQTDLAQRVKAILAQLPAEDRALVHWHYFEEQSLADIAEVLGTTRDALKMRLSRLRTKLRMIWKDEK